MEPDDLIDLMRKRRTTREYQLGAVDNLSLNRILESVTLPPTGAGLLPYIVIVVRDPVTKSNMRRRAEEAEAIYHDRLSGVLKEKFDAMNITYEKPFLTQASVLLVIAGDTTKPYWKESTWLAIGYLVLAIENEGLGSLTYTPSDVSFLSELLNIPEKFTPQVILPVGHIAERSPPKHARPVGRIFDEKYGAERPAKSCESRMLNATVSNQ